MTSASIEESEPTWVGVDPAARFAGVSRSTILRALSSRDIPVHEDGGRCLVPPERVFAHRQGRGGPTQTTFQGSLPPRRASSGQRGGDAVLGIVDPTSSYQSVAGSRDTPSGCLSESQPSTGNGTSARPSRSRCHDRFLMNAAEALFRAAPLVDDLAATLGWSRASAEGAILEYLTAIRSSSDSSRAEMRPVSRRSARSAGADRPGSSRSCPAAPGACSPVCAD